MKVLVTGGHTPAALAVARSLGKTGVHVEICSSTKLNPSFFSKYCKKGISVPKSEDFRKFKTRIVGLLKNGKYEFLIPTTDSDMIACSFYKKEFEKYTKIPIMDYDKLIRVMDKERIIIESEKVGVPIPKTYFLKNSKNLKENIDKIKFPVILRPRFSRYLDKKNMKLVSTSRRVCYSRESLIKNYEEIERIIPRPIIQEYFIGKGYGFYALCDKGKTVARTMIERVHEVPFYGGPSYIRKSIHDKRLNELGYKLIKHLKYSGVAMLEFRKDYKDNKFKIIEVNARFWGSLEASIKSGVDFPYLWIVNPSDKKHNKFKTDVLTRYLFTGEVSYLLSILFYKKKNKLARNPKKLASLVEFFSIFFKPRMNYDYFQLNDLMPAVVKMLRSIRDLFEVLWNKMKYNKSVRNIELE